MVSRAWVWLAMISRAIASAMIITLLGFAMSSGPPFVPHPGSGFPQQIRIPAHWRPRRRPFMLLLWKTVWGLWEMLHIVA